MTTNFFDKPDLDFYVECKFIIFYGLWIDHWCYAFL